MTTDDPVRSDLTNANRFVVEYLAPGIIIKRSINEHLCIFDVSYSGASSIDSWKQYALQVLFKWPSSSPCLLLHDFHQTSIFGLGINLLPEIEKLYWSRPELKRRVGLILPRNFGLDLVTELDIKIRELNAPYAYPVRWQVFKRRMDALYWLTHEQKLN